MTVNKLSLLSGILGVCVGSSVWAMDTSAVQLCTESGCKEATQVATPVALYERLGELFTKNTGRKITFCDADPAIRLCFQQKLMVSASSPFMTANVSVDSADMTDVKISGEETSLTALLDMSVEANGTYPTCGTAQAKVIVGDSDKVSMVIDNFGCAFTSTLVSDLNMGFAVDYIDFEKAVLGGYYTFSASQAMHGMRSGYALLRFAEPVSGQFDGVVPALETSATQLVVKDTKTPVQSGDKECAPCVAEQIRDDAVVRSAIEAAARAEAEAKVAAERAVKMAEEAAQTTNDYALKKAEEAEKAKQEAEKAAEMALAARSRVDTKVAAMNCQTVEGKDNTATPKEGSSKQTTTITTTVKRYDANGNEIEPIVMETVSETKESMADTADNTRGTPADKESHVEESVIKPVVEVENSDESFSQKWNRWMDKAGKVFWLEEPLF